MACACSSLQTLIVGDNQSVDPTVFSYSDGTNKVTLTNVDIDGAPCNPQPLPGPCPVRITTGCDTRFKLAPPTFPADLQITFQLDGTAGAIGFSSPGIYIDPQPGIFGPASPTNNTWTWPAGLTQIVVRAGSINDFSFRGGPVRLCSVTWVG